MKKFSVAAALVIFLAGAVIGQKGKDQVQEQKKELDRIKAELELKRSSIEKLKGKEKGILSELADAEEELDLVSRLIKKMGRQEQALTKKISLSNLGLLGTQIVLGQKRELLASRLNQVYRYGKFYQTRMLLSADSPVDFLKRFYFLEKLTQNDRELIGQVLQNMSQIEQTKSELMANLDELQRLKKDKIREEQNRQKVHAQKERLLGNVRQEKKLQEQAAAQLEESMLAIQKVIEESEKKRVSAYLPEGVFAASKGRLPWPVQGEIIATFGEQTDPKTKTVTFNPGIEIKAEIGSQVLAVADGVAIYNGWLRGYGRFIILQHDSGFYTLYGHLDEVLVEEATRVAAGDPIGRVGDSGSLFGPALHFEIRQGKQQFDPMEWLK